MTFEIDHNIPMPTSKPTAKYPFGDMVIGDSFLVPIGDDQERTVMQRISNSANGYSKRHGGKFIVRVVDDGSAVRCWKVE